MSALDNVNGDQLGAYRMPHQPTGGAGLHDIGSELPDFYEHPEYYEFGDPSVDREATTAAMRTRGQPDAKVVIYRSAPEGVTHINPGDWVTTSRQHAKNEGAGQGEGGKDFPVYRASVPARHVTFGGNDHVEFGYTGDKPIPVSSSGRRRSAPKPGEPGFDTSSPLAGAGQRVTSDEINDVVAREEARLAKKRRNR